MKVVHFFPEVLKRLHPFLSPYVARETENSWFGRRTAVYNVVSAIFKHGCPLLYQLGGCRLHSCRVRRFPVVRRLAASRSSRRSFFFFAALTGLFGKNPFTICIQTSVPSSLFREHRIFRSHSLRRQERLPFEVTRIFPSQC